MNARLTTNLRSMFKTIIISNQIYNTPAMQLLYITKTYTQKRNNYNNTYYTLRLGKTSLVEIRSFPVTSLGGNITITLQVGTSLS